MENLKKEINKELEILKELIKQEKDVEVKKQRKILDKLLSQYLKNLQKELYYYKLHKQFVYTILKI